MPTRGSGVHADFNPEGSEVPSVEVDRPANGGGIETRDPWLDIVPCSVQGRTFRPCKGEESADIAVVLWRSVVAELVQGSRKVLGEAPGDRAIRVGGERLTAETKPSRVAASAKTTWPFRFEPRIPEGRLFGFTTRIKGPPLSMQESHRRGQSPLVVPENIDAETPRCDLPDSIHDAKRQRIRERIRFRSSALPGAARPGPAAPPASPVSGHHSRGGWQPNTPSDASRMPRRQTSSSSWACTGHAGCGTKHRQDINTRVKQVTHERAEWESAASAKAAGHWRCGALLDTHCSNRPVLSNAPFATARKRSFPPQVPLRDSLFQRSQRLGPISEHVFGVNNERIGVSH